MSDLFISPDEARARFGALTVTSGAVTTDIEVVVAGGTWKPCYSSLDLVLIGYEFHADEQPQPTESGEDE
jgi:hypothetical protein